MIDTSNTLPLLREQYQNCEDMWEQDENGVEFIYARNLQKLFDYGSWDKFSRVIEKAKISCKNNDIEVEYHFSQVGKMITIGNGGEREVEDVKLTRYACYLIAQNGDPRKAQIAFAQHYFAVQTRRFEKIVDRMDKIERIESREKLRETEKEFSRIAYERGVKNEEFAIIKSSGDQAYYGGKTTRQMKDKLGIPAKRPLHDFTPKAVTLGKALANAITSQNVVTQDKRGMKEISKSHVASNKNVRAALIKSGIYPEKISKEKDIKQIASEIKKRTRRCLRKARKAMRAKPRRARKRRKNHLNPVGYKVIFGENRVSFFPSGKNVILRLKQCVSIILTDRLI